MATSRKHQEKVEGYARALLDASKAEGRAIPDLVQWRHATKFSPEVIATLAAMDADEDNRLISEVYAEFKRLVDADDSIVSVTATTAVGAAVTGAGVGTGVTMGVEVLSTATTRLAAI